MLKLTIQLFHVLALEFHHNVLEKSIELNPDLISYLLGIHNLTPRRIEYTENAGYYIKKLHLCKIHKWYGMSCIVIWLPEIQFPVISGQFAPTQNGFQVKLIIPALTLVGNMNMLELV
jgi:hypothetical protein